MIIVYPMLVSSNVQSHILPGIAKVLEKYTLTYQLDDIIQNSERLIKGKKLKRTGAMLKLSENNNLIEAKGDDNYNRLPPEKPGEKATVKIDMPTFNTLSLEPTWIKIDTNIGTSMIGIKIVPFPVQSDTNLINLITDDFYTNWIKSKIKGLGRSIIRTLYTVLHKTPLLRRLTPTITGDPKKDIIFARTFHNHNLFLVLNSMDVGQDFLERTNKIKQLYKLGWSSFVITDDINRRCFFCMREFHGMCSSVQYNFMYATIGKEHGKVFDDLEDVKKSSSPFFKLSTKASKIVAEQYVIDKINRFYIND